MASLTEQLKILIESVSTGTGFKTAAAESEGLAAQTTLTGKAMSKLGLDGAKTGDLLKAVAPVAVGAAFVKFGLDAVEAFAGATSAVRGFQRVSGTSAEDASKLTFAVKELGVAPDSAATAFGRLATRLGTGKVDLAQYGVEVAKNKDGTTDLAGTVANLADAYQKTADPTARAALANEAFGKSWQTLAPLLGKSAGDLKQIYDQAGKDHQLFSQDDLERGREFALATKQLSDAFSGLKIELGQALIPVVTQTATTLTSGIQAADDAAGAIGGLSGAATILTGNLNPLQFGAHGVSAATSLMSGHFADAGKNALEALPGVGGFATALFGGEEASNKFTDAQNRQTQAVQSAADLVSQGKQHTKEYADAIATAKSATEELSGASQKLANSLQTQAEKQYAASQAALASSVDHIAVSNAVANVSTGLDKLNTQLVANMVAGDSSKAATDALAQGQRDLATEVLNVTAASAKQAVDNLGPNASAADKMKAATDAQNTALQYLYAQFPGLETAVHDYVGALGTVPPTVTTGFVLNNFPEALRQSYELLNVLNTLNGMVATSTVEVRENVVQGLIAGQIGSDRNTKSDLTLADPDYADEILAKIISGNLPVSTWRYKWESDDVRHIGPMAQDFAAAFGFGNDDRSIQMVDAIGVLLLAVQALARRLDDG